MSTCYNCGGEIIFRYVDGQVTPIHLSGSCYGYYSGPSDPVRESWGRPPTPVERASESWAKGHARSDSGVAFTHPTTCPICGALIFFHTNGNGDVVFFDELGPPWPKHPCLSTEESRRTASRSAALMALVNLYAPPKIIHPPASAAIRSAPARNLPITHAEPPTFLGVVTRVTDRIAWRSRPDSVVRSRVRLSLLDICLGVGRSTAIHIPSTLSVSVGEVVALRPVHADLDRKDALYAETLDRVPFTGDFIDTRSTSTRARSTAQPRMTVPAESSETTESPRASLLHPILADLGALATGCPLVEVVRVVQTHVVRASIVPIDKELFPPLRDAFRKAIESGARDLAAGWLLAMELVPFTRRSTADWRNKARRVLGGASLTTP
jgi:hypothetical protein